MFKKIFGNEVHYVETSNFEVVKAHLKKHPNNIVILDGDRHVYKVRVFTSKFDIFITKPLFKLLFKIYNKLYPEQIWS